MFLISAARHDDGEQLTVHYDTCSGVAPHEAIGLLQYVHTLILRNAHSR